MISIEQDAGWVPQPVWTLLRREKYYACRESKDDSSTQRPVVQSQLPTELSLPASLNHTLITFNLSSDSKGNMIRVLYVHGTVYRNSLSINVQQDATRRSLFYLQTALHVSGGFSTHHQEHK